MKDQWLTPLDIRDFHTLDELRGKIRRLSAEEIEKDLLLEIERRVSVDSVIIIDHTEYEVDYRFTRQIIRLRYSADMKEIYIVEADGTLTPTSLLNKTENAYVKREKFHLCGGEEAGTLIIPHGMDWNLIFS